MYLTILTPCLIGMQKYIWIIHILKDWYGEGRSKIVKPGIFCQGISPSQDP